MGNSSGRPTPEPPPNRRFHALDVQRPTYIARHSQRRQRRQGAQHGCQRPVHDLGREVGQDWGSAHGGMENTLKPVLAPQSGSAWPFHTTSTNTMDEPWVFLFHNPGTPNAHTAPPQTHPADDRCFSFPRNEMTLKERREAGSVK